MPLKRQLWCAGVEPLSKACSEAMGCSCHLLIHGSTGKESCETVRDAGHHLQTKPEPYVGGFYPNPTLFYGLRSIIANLISFSLKKCLHTPYKKMLLCLSCLNWLLDNQLLAPQPSEVWERHMFLGSETLPWCHPGFTMLAKNHQKKACLSTAHSCLLINIPWCIVTLISSIFNHQWQILPRSLAGFGSCVSEKCGCSVHFYWAQQLGASDVKLMWVSACV